MIKKMMTGLMFIVALQASAAEYASDFKGERVWAGPEYWAHPLEAWQVSNGRIEIVPIMDGGIAFSGQALNLLTHFLKGNSASFTAEVIVGLPQGEKGLHSGGMRLGIASDQSDARATLLRITSHYVDVGLDEQGHLFIDKINGIISLKTEQSVKLLLTAEPVDESQMKLRLQALDKLGKELAILEHTVAAERLVGNVAVVNGFHRGATGKRVKDLHRLWFNDFKFGGDKVGEDKTRSFGPILWSQYTLSRKVLKLTAQMPPIGPDDSHRLSLEVKNSAGRWQTVATEIIDALSRNATFRINNWDDSKDAAYRVRYNWQGKDYFWAGTVRRDPVDRPLKVGAFTGCGQQMFPNHTLVNTLKIQQPDFLFFSGDQLYEYEGGFGTFPNPIQLSSLNYLRRWYMFGWSFRDLLKDRPSIIIPDDHDYFQGNFFGAGGIQGRWQDLYYRGGLVMDGEMINVVHRTQCGHLPDPWDARKLDRGIEPYHTELVYGRVSFAVVADRLFKSGPGIVSHQWYDPNWRSSKHPEGGAGRPDHLHSKTIPIEKLDHPDAKLLGDRQLQFLKAWADTWDGVDEKCLLSQTILCNLANYHGHKQTYVRADLDSNGWPRGGRQKALGSARRAGAFMIAGDQHLASIVQHGLAGHEDAGFSFCVPSIGTTYPRRWQPDREGLPVSNRISGLANTGNYVDPFGNHITVHAIANPEDVWRKPLLEHQHDKTSGHGIVTFDQQQGKISMECWKLLFDANNPKAEDQHPGWPRTIHSADNLGLKGAKYFLPEIQLSSEEQLPVVRVIDEGSGDILYSYRLRKPRFTPHVFKAGTYRVQLLKDSGEVTDEETYKVGVAGADGGPK